MLSRRQFIGGCISALAAGGGTWLYATEAEPFWPQFVKRKLPVRGLPGELEGARLVQLSDIHVGERVPDYYLLRCFERIASLEPDIVVITGDLTQYSDAEHSERVYARLPQGRLATACVLGNHDYGRGWAEPIKADELAAMLGGLSMTVLRNESIEVSGLQIIGLDDIWANRFDPRGAFAAADPAIASVCLSHNPDTADMEGWGWYDGWVLAGHTHGGQCKPPFLEPPILPVENRRYTAGVFDIGGGRRMYINRGLGFLRQARFNARPEVTLFELADGSAGGRG